MRTSSAQRPSCSVADEVARLVAFARELRGEGLAMGPGRVVEFCRAAARLPPENLYWAGRLTLVSRPEEIPIYDRVFRGIVEPDSPTRQVRVVEEAVSRASPRELLRTKSFAELSKDELADLAELMKRLQVNVPSRRTRRREPARKGSPDLRRTLRRSFRTGGEPVERAWLSAADAKEVLRRAAAEVVDWNGGTR